MVVEEVVNAWLNVLSHVFPIPICCIYILITYPNNECNAFNIPFSDNCVNPLLNTICACCLVNVCDTCYHETTIYLNMTSSWRVWLPKDKTWAYTCNACMKTNFISGELGWAPKILTNKRTQKLLLHKYIYLPAGGRGAAVLFARRDASLHFNTMSSIPGTYKKHGFFAATTYNQ